MRTSWTKEQLIQAVKSTKSIRQVLRVLKLREAGGNYTQIKKYIRMYKLDISHFAGKGWSKGLRGIGKPRIPLLQILTAGNDYQSFKLKKRLFREGMKQRKCELCDWAEQAADGRVPLELDHINGDRRDNRLENLRILCPNCHSLQSTHRGLNRKRKNGLVAEWYTHDT